MNARLTTSNLKAIYVPSGCKLGGNVLYGFTSNVTVCFEDSSVPDGTSSRWKGSANVTEVFNVTREQFREQYQAK